MTISYLIAFVMAAMGTPHATGDAGGAMDPNGATHASATAGGGDRGGMIDPNG